MIIELDIYQIRPANPGLVLYKKVVGGRVIDRGMHKGKVTSDGWRSMGLYPHNLHHALQLIADDYGRHGRTKESRAGKKAVNEYLVDLANYARDVANSATIIEEKVSLHDGHI